MEILCFYAGIAFYYYKNLYPLVFIWILFFFRAKISYFLWFTAAFLLAFVHQYFLSHSGISARSLIKNAKLSGYIISLPQTTSQKSQFQFFADSLNGKQVTSTMMLTCYYACPEIHAGERWQLIATLKKPVNLANIGGFDYVAWLGSRHIDWIGNVRQASFIKLSSLKNYRLLTLRERLANSLSQLIPKEEILGVVQALTIGVTQHIGKEQWELFRRTGTTHLIDISGEHIALIAGFVFMLVKFLWTRWARLCVFCPAQKVASIIAMMLTLLYALIAGFSVPTQRAVLMGFFFLLRNVVSVRYSTWQAWRYALFTVLLFEPHSVLMMGFYFSFLAVAILILIHQKFNDVPSDLPQTKNHGELSAGRDVEISSNRVWKFIPHATFNQLNTGKIKKLLLMQLACIFGLMPLSLFWFSFASINGLITNFVAIPWVGFVIVPLALFVTALCQWFVIPGSVEFLKWNISSLLQVLEWLDAHTGIFLDVSFTSLLAPIALMLVMSFLVLLPIRRLLPAVGAVVLGSISPRFEVVQKEHARVDVLDVGQGLSVIIRTAHHLLIYDTGMELSQSSDMGKLAIIPYLKALGVSAVDKIVISHPDLDHRGGLRSVEERFVVNELIVNNPPFYKRGKNCHEYPAWTWDGVVFEFLALNGNLSGQNNNSCVLKVSTHDDQILLTGDIEKPAEEFLVQAYGRKLNATILLVPHHGSKTSSTPKFLAQVAPKYALASYGVNNKYHFPHDQAMRNYQLHNTAVYNRCAPWRLKAEARSPR